MTPSATLFEPAAPPHARAPWARAPWPLSEPTLAYFPDARFGQPDRDLGAGVTPLAIDEATHPPHRPGGSVVAPSDEPSRDHGHVPVLLERCVELLTPVLTARSADGSGAVLVDATVGAGGHSARFLSQFPGLRLIGLDRDPAALAIAAARLESFGERVNLVRTRYDGIAAALTETGLAATDSVDGVLFDLGVSSMQLDRPERGFSYSQDAPLDMRMDPDAELTAAEILNSYDRAGLTVILRRFGEE